MACCLVYGCYSMCERGLLCPPHAELVGLTAALSLLRDLEYGSRHLTDGVLVPCCPDCDAEPGQAHSEACRVDGVLRRSG